MPSRLCSARLCEEAPVLSLCGFGSSVDMAQCLQFVRQNLDVAPTFAARHRHDFALAPVVVIREVMHLAMEERLVPLQFAKVEVRQVERDCEVMAAVAALSFDGQCHFRG